MPPLLALLFYIIFVGILFRLEKKRNPRLSGFLWIPLIWIVISASRFVSQWFDSRGAADITDGSPLDRAVFLALIFGASLVVLKKRIPWGKVIGRNFWLALLLAYSGISVLWSDFPFVAFKRWVKEIGNLLMVMVVLSETDPFEAVKTVLKKLAYILIPLSVVLIKYFPEYGRGYDDWTGEVMYVGVGLNKNYIGLLCLTCGFFFLWHLSDLWGHRSEGKDKRVEILIAVGFLAMTFWLFQKAESATALACFLAGGGVLFALKAKRIRKNLKSVGTIAAVVCLTVVVLQVSFDLEATVVEMLGRKSSLTDRVPLWKDILSLETDPLFGTGYYSFWLGERAETIWKKWWWHPNSTHNGYLNTYVTLGLIGVTLLGMLILSTFRKAKRSLLSDYEYGRIRMGWLIVILLYNYTESAFSGVNLIWLVFLLLAIDYPGSRKTPFGNSSIAKPFNPGTLPP